MTEPPSESLTIEELIERSSLGTPEAKAIRESVDPDLARRIVDRANALSREWDHGVGGGQCSSCLRTTIVRGFRDPDDPLDDLDVWLCKPCWLNPNGEDDV